MPIRNIPNIKTFSLKTISKNCITKPIGIVRYLQMTLKKKLRTLRVAKTGPEMPFT